MSRTIAAAYVYDHCVLDLSFHGELCERCIVADRGLSLQVKRPGFALHGLGQ
jgi:hypothetical protein